MLTAQLDLFATVTPPITSPAIARRYFVWCWGRCGGWGWREHRLGELTEVPCDEPGCLRERWHDPPHNPRPVS